MATVRVLSRPDGGGLRISGPKLCGCCAHEIVEVQPEDLTARERHDLQDRAAMAERLGYPDAAWLEEMVDRAYGAERAATPAKGEPDPEPFDYGDSPEEW